MTCIVHYLVFVFFLQTTTCAVIKRSAPQQSSKSILSSRNCFFSPTQCFLPRVFDKYVPAEKTSSMLGKSTHRIRLHHMIKFLKNTSQSKLYH